MKTKTTLEELWLTDLKNVSEQIFKLFEEGSTVMYSTSYHADAFNKAPNTSLENEISTVYNRTGVYLKKRVALFQNVCILSGTAQKRMSWINWLTSFTRLRPVIVTVILQNCWALEQNRMQQKYDDKHSDREK
jgi:hypothetical protein